MNKSENGVYFQRLSNLSICYEKRSNILEDLILKYFSLNDKKIHFLKITVWVKFGFRSSKQLLGNNDFKLKLNSENYNI